MRKNSRKKGRDAGEGELLPVNFIRTETLLRKHPLHVLQSQGSSEVKEITVIDYDLDGKAVTRWRVLFGAPEGAAGPLAYRIDRLIIDRAIEAHSAPEIPRTLRLGTFNEICRELGLVETGPNKKNIRAALLQLQGTMIDIENVTAHARYYRYERVIFTGEDTGEGRSDAIYITLSDTYRELLRKAPRRPLDYDYLKDLSPASARLYEIISSRVFAALKKERNDAALKNEDTDPLARIRYSEFCELSALTRHEAGHMMRKQMKKLHAPHIKSGYISEVSYDPRKDVRPDWMIIYKPGPKARQEFEAAELRGELHRAQVVAFPNKTEPPDEGEHRELVSRLQGAGVSHSQAIELVRLHPEYAKKWCSVYESGYFRKMRIQNSGGYLVRAIIEGFPIPQFPNKTPDKPNKETRDIIRAEKEVLNRKHKELLRWWAELLVDEKNRLITEALDSLPAEQRKFYEQMDREGPAFIELVYSYASS